MEREIKERFTFNGKIYIVEKSDRLCANCAFLNSKCTADFDVVGNCSSHGRTDKESVIFKELNINMKPFNFREVKAGKAVCTRNGRKVRILCTDVKDKNVLVVAITNDDGTEMVWTYSASGKFYGDEEHDLDLMMVSKEEVEKEKENFQDIRITPELREATQKYDYLFSFSEGLAMVKKGDFFGFINKNGEEVIPCRYEDAYSFSEGFARVRKGHLYGFINKNGEEVIPYKYNYACSFMGGIAVVRVDGRWGFVDKYGNCTLEK